MSFNELIKQVIDISRQNQKHLKALEESVQELQEGVKALEEGVQDLQEGDKNLQGGSKGGSKVTQGRLAKFEGILSAFSYPAIVRCVFETFRRNHLKMADVRDPDNGQIWNKYLKSKRGRTRLRFLTRAEIQQLMYEETYVENEGGSAWINRFDAESYWQVNDPPVRIQANVLNSRVPVDEQEARDLILLKKMLQNNVKALNWEALNPAKRLKSK